MRLLQHFRHRKRGGCNLQKAVHSPVVEVHANGENVHDYVDVKYRIPICAPVTAQGVCKNIKIAPEPEVDAETSGCSRYPANQ